MEVPGVALGLATAFALSPALVDLARHWIELPWTRYSVVFVPLTIVWIARADRKPPSRDGVLWIVVSILMAALLVAGGLRNWSRLAIPVAVLGLCRMRGLAATKVALLALFIVPMPALLNRLTAPVWPELVTTLAASLTGVFFSNLQIVDGVARFAAQELPIENRDGGFFLAFLFIGIGWARALTRSLGAPASARSLAIWAASCVPVQVGVWIAALALLAGAGAEAARALLDQAPLLLALVGATWLLRLPKRSR